MRSVPLALFLALAASPVADAQRIRDAPRPEVARVPSGVCGAGGAVAVLDVPGVRTDFRNAGQWTGDPYGTFEMPKGWGVWQIWTSQLWIGGARDGVPHFAGSVYGSAGARLAPGPLGADGQPDAALCAAHDRVWTVRTSDLDAFAATGTPTDDLAGWPVGAGAPFYVDADGDGIQGPAEPTVALRPGDPAYDPARAIDLGAGERPVVYGAQTAWWVMNDLGTGDAWGRTPPIGLEVRATAWALGDYDRPDLLEALFFRYDVLNRSDAVDDVFLGFETEADLGSYRDNYLHSDTTRSMVVVYNSDAFDPVHGVPPALGFDFLSGGYGSIRPGSRHGHNAIAGSGADAYHYLRALWLDGTHISEGGDGFLWGEGEPVTWLFPGDPVARAFWSEEDRDGEGRQQDPGGWFHMRSAELGDLAPGAEATVDVGVLFAWGADRLDSVVRLRDVSDIAQAAYADGSLFRTVHVQPDPAPPATPALLAPADGAAFRGEPVTFAWTPAAGADRYRLELSRTADFSDVFRDYGTPSTTFEAPLEALPENRSAPLYWRVQPWRQGVAGPPSEGRALTAYTYVEGALRLADGSFAFVEVVGPGGADPCGPEAGSTGGCDEVFGNGIDRSENSTGVVVGKDEGAADRLAATTPSEFELRFTADGAPGYTFDGTVFTLPFEVWDIGQVAPGRANDPSDDRQLVPVLYLDFSAEDAAACRFAFEDQPSDWPDATALIFGYHPVDDDFEAYAADAAAAIATAPDGCASGDAAASVAARIDSDRPYRFGPYRFQRAGEAEIDAMAGAVIRFYSASPNPVAADERPEAGGLALAVHPNPSARRATVDLTLSEASAVRLRVLDVLGREVAVLAEGDRSAGEHRATLDTAALAPGVYVVVLETDRQRAVQTITVVR